MTEQVEVAQEEVLAPEVELPASAQTPAEPQEVETEQPLESEEQHSQPAKTFTQEDVDAIAAKERAKAERRAEKRARADYERRLEELTRQAPGQQQAAPKQEGKPKLADFTDPDEWADAVFDWKQQQHQEAQMRQIEAQRQVQAARELEMKAHKVMELAEDEPGFDIDAFAKVPNTLFTDAMMFAVVDSDIPAKLLVHLQSNPSEMERIAKYAPARQAAEIGKLEVKLTTPAKVPASKAPAPVKPIGQRGGAATADPSKMGQDEFEKWFYRR